MRMDEIARQMKKDGIYIYLIAKDMPIQGEKTLKPRPNYRVWTKELHCVCHGNSRLFDNSPVSQLELKKAWPHPVQFLLRDFIVDHGDPPFTHLAHADKALVDVT